MSLFKENALIHQKSGLAASYGRRAWGASLAGAALTTSLLIAHAQDSAPATPNSPAKPAAAKKATAAKKKTTAKSGKSQTTAKTGAAGTRSASGVSITPVPGQTAGGAQGAGQPGGRGGQGGNAQGGGRPGGFGGGQGGFGGGRGGRGFGGGGFGGNTGGFAGGRPAAGTLFQFDFHGSDVDNVLRFFSNMSGLTITKDPGLTGPVTVINPRSVTLDEAFKILQSILYVRGFSAVQSGSVLQILPFKGAAKSTSVLNPGINEDGTTLVDARNQFMTQVIPITSGDAQALATELKDLASPDAIIIGSPGTNSLIITDTASNVSRFITLVEALDKSTNQSALKIYSLTRADATAIAQDITNVYSQSNPQGGGRGGRGGGGGGGFPGFNPGGGAPGQPGGAPASSRPSVVAVADVASNSVLVVATPAIQEQIARDIIGRLDGDEASRLETVTRKVNFANAQDVADAVNNVLSLQRPGGGQQQGNQPSFQQRFFGGGGGGGFGGFGGGGGGGQQQGAASTDPFGKVVADPRTNTLLITASRDRLVRINDLVDKLDVEVPVEPTTFVFPLKNAQAQDVSTALSQAFGTTQTNGGGNSIFNFGGGNNTSSNPFGRQGGATQRRLGTGTGTGTNGRGARAQNLPPGPPNAPDDEGSFQDNGQGDVQTNGGSAQPQGVSGVMTNQGFVPTEATGEQATATSRTRQFGGQQRGGAGGQRQGLGSTSSPQYGRGRNGGYSNLLQLQNNVFVTPSPGGDSIIVTTLPENYAALQQIIEALDIVPRQVMIEVIIAEVTLSDDQKLGFTLGGNFLKLFGQQNSGSGQVNLQGSGFGNAFDPLANGGQFVLNGGNYSALLQALTTDNKVRVLATPRVFASNNQQADLNIVTQIPFIQGTTTTGFSSVVSTQVQTAPIGYQLQVTPRITRQGLVTIDVSQDATDLLRFQTLGSGSSASIYPVINDRSTDTSVTIQDGQTVVIGGLIRNNRALNITKIPVLSDIPLIGQFFRSREITHDKTELMIFMTPHVVNTVEDARQLSIQSGAPLIREIPELSQQQPNLTLPTPPKGVKLDLKTLPKDSSGRPYYPGPKGNNTGAGTKNPASNVPLTGAGTAPTGGPTPAPSTQPTTGSGTVGGGGTQNP